MDPNKYIAIMEWSILISIFEVRNLHGLTNFYQNFIRDFNEICAPLTTSWEKESFNGMQQSNHTKKIFEWLKNKVSKKQVFTLLYFGKVFKVDCDASGTIIVLNQ